MEVDRWLLLCGGHNRLPNAEPRSVTVFDQQRSVAGSGQFNVCVIALPVTKIELLPMPLLRLGASQIVDRVNGSIARIVLDHIAIGCLAIASDLQP